MAVTYLTVTLKDLRHLKGLKISLLEAIQQSEIRLIRISIHVFSELASESGNDRQWTDCVRLDKSGKVVQNYGSITVRARDLLRRCLVYSWELVPVT